MKRAWFNESNDEDVKYDNNNNKQQQALTQDNQLNHDNDDDPFSQSTWQVNLIFFSAFCLSSFVNN